MNQATPNKRNTIRNLIIFVIVLNLLGWLGWLVAQDGTAESVGLGTLIWLGAPLLVSLLIRLLSKDWSDIGIKPNFKGNGRWYLFSFLIFPIIVILVVLVGVLFGSISLANFRAGPYLQSLVAAFISFTLVKNFLEEFAWRGYLTPKVNLLVKNPILGHIIVGLIWGFWHIPYYLALLDQTSLAAYTSQNLAIFIPMVILSMAVAGILFGEIRLLTDSTWPAWLMHMMSNTIILTLLVDGYLSVNPKTEFLFTPSWEGLLMLALIAAAGLWLYQSRRKV